MTSVAMFAVGVVIGAGLYLLLCHLFPGGPNF